MHANTHPVPDHKLLQAELTDNSSQMAWRAPGCDANLVMEQLRYRYSKRGVQFTLALSVGGRRKTGRSPAALRSSSWLDLAVSKPEYHRLVKAGTSRFANADRDNSTRVVGVEQLDAAQLRFGLRQKGVKRATKRQKRIQVCRTLMPSKPPTWKPLPRSR